VEIRSRTAGAKAWYPTVLDRLIQQAVMQDYSAGGPDIL